MNATKIIAMFKAKGKTHDETPCKITCAVYDNGIMIFQKMILVKSEYKTPMFFHRLTTKFGFDLLISEFSFKYSTYCEFGKITNEKLKENFDKITKIL